MMGHTHSLSGAVAYLAVTPLLATHVPITPGAVILGAGAAAGAAMLPDFDHPQATIAHVYGLPTRLLARALARISGGHRHGTHSLLGLTLTVYLSGACLDVQGPALAILLLLLLGTAAKALHVWHPEHPTLSAIALAAVLGSTTGAALMAHVSLDVLPWAVGIGYASHLAGDALTPGGVPLAWPMPHRYGLTLVTTNSWVERYLLAAALSVAGLTLVVIRTGLIDLGGPT